MKRIISILLAAAMLCSCLVLLTSCGNDEFIIGYTLFAPMNFKDEEGNLVGFETEFAEAVCEKLGYKAKFQIIDWNAKETELNSGKIDCIWNGMTITDERKANMGISDPYMENKQVVVVKAENAEKFSNVANLKGANVVAEQGSAGEEVVKTDGIFAGSQYTAVDKQSKTLLEVKSGTADCAVLDYVASIGMIGEGTDYEDLVVLDAYEFAKEEYGIAFRKDDTELREEFQKAIDELMADGTIENIAKKYKLQDLLIKK